MSNLDSVFNTFVSGSNAFSNRFTEYSYNVSNAGTIAAKKRSSFLSTLNSIATPTQFVPAGVAYTPTINIETIGGVTPSQTQTNFMVNAKALVVLNENASNTNPGRYGFTKVTTFYPDKNGDLVNHAGQFLKVVLTNPDGTPQKTNVSTFDQLSTLNVKDRVGLPLATTYIDIFAGLPSAAAIGDNYSQTKLVYDPKGNNYNVTFKYEKIASQAGSAGPPVVVADPANSERWQITATAATTAETPPLTVVPNVAWTNGVDVVFKNGLPILINEGVAVPDLTITPPSGYAATPFNIAVNLGTVNKSDGITSLNGTLFGNRDIEADGKGSGKFVGLTWDKDGFGVISYSNGETEKVCRIPLVTFRSMNSLVEGSNGIFYTSDESGPYSLRFPNSEIIASALEESTASGTDAYVNMARDGKRFNACLSGLTKTIDMLGSLERLLEKS